MTNSSYLLPVADFVATIKKHNPSFADEIQAAVIDLHNQGFFSEGYAAHVLKLDRIHIRELAQSPAPPRPKTNAQKVSSFHAAMGITLPTVADVPAQADLILSMRLINEEVEETLTEFMEAIAANEDKTVSYGHVANLLGELADLLYVTYGAMLRWGIDPDLIFNEVHEANMRKAGGRRNAHGKIMKPEGWVGADLVGLIKKIQEEQTP
jgi:predicted HAD superfamily Cof-like phosphohydrolase